MTINETIEARKKLDGLKPPMPEMKRGKHTVYAVESGGLVIRIGRPGENYVGIDADAIDLLHEFLDLYNR